MGGSVPSRATLPADSPTSIFAIQQGGLFEDLRRENSVGMVGLDFPGYAVGGLSVGEEREDTMRTAEFAVGELPEAKPRYMMGMGTPLDLVDLCGWGYDLFDCVLPTRNGRNGSAFTASYSDVTKTVTFTAKNPAARFSVDTSVAFTAAGNGAGASATLVSHGAVLNRASTAGEIWTARLQETGATAVTETYTVAGNAGDDTLVEIAGILLAKLQAKNLPGAYDPYRFTLAGTTLIATNLKGSNPTAFTFSVAVTPVTTPPTSTLPDVVMNPSAATVARALTLTGTPRPGEQWQLNLSDASGALVSLTPYAVTYAPKAHPADDTTGEIAQILFDQLTGASFATKGEFDFSLTGSTLRVVRNGVAFTLGLNVIPATLNGAADLATVQVAQNYTQRIDLDGPLAANDVFTIEIDNARISAGTDTSEECA